jgi:hypothetical protein
LRGELNEWALATSLEDVLTDLFWMFGDLIRRPRVIPGDAKRAKVFLAHIFLQVIAIDT